MQTAIDLTATHVEYLNNFVSELNKSKCTGGDLVITLKGTEVTLNGELHKVTKKNRQKFVDDLNKLIPRYRTTTINGYTYAREYQLRAVYGEKTINFTALPAVDFSDLLPLQTFITNFNPELPIAFDTETSFDKERSKANHLTQTEIRFIQLAQTPEDAIMIRVTDDNKAALAALLGQLTANPDLKWIIHNARFDCWVIRKFLGLTIAGRIYDTLIVSQALYAGFPRSVRHDLGSVAKRLLGIDLDKSHQASDWAKPLTAAQIDYALDDVRLLPAIREALIARAVKEQQTHIMNLELQFLPVPIYAQIDGVQFDIDKALAYEAKCAIDVQRLKDALSDMFGCEFNPRSSQQKIKALNDQIDELEEDPNQENGIEKITSAAAGVLKVLNLKANLPAVQLLLDYAKAEKQRQMVASLVKLYYDGGTGRIHTSFNPMGAQTGRLSASQPNTQNIPRGSGFRELFIAPPGKRFIICDFSQIELRIAAELANERNMIEAFNANRDLHTTTAVLIWGNGATYEEFEAILNDKHHSRFSEIKGYRQLAKSANFGLVYGSGAGGLQAYIFNSSGKLMSLEECQDLRDNFFKAYPALAAWHRKLGNDCKRLPCTYTLFRRKRYFPLRWSKEDLSSGRRTTIWANSPTQGTGADAFKLAAIEVRQLIYSNEYIARFGSAKIVLMVHDEIVVEVDDNEATEQGQLIAQAMMDASQPLLAKVPVIVEPDVGRDWSDKH